MIGKFDKEGPDLLVSLYQALIVVKRSAGVTKRGKSRAVDPGWENIKIIRRVDKDRRYVPVQSGLEIGVFFGACRRIGQATGGLQNLIDLGIGVLADVEAGIIALGRVPERIWIRIAADDFSEDQNVEFSGPDDVLIKIAQIKYLDCHTGAQGLPLAGQFPGGRF